MTRVGQKHMSFLKVIEDSVKELRRLQPFEISSLAPPASQNTTEFHASFDMVPCDDTVTLFEGKQVVAQFNAFISLHMVDLYVKRLALYFLEYGQLWTSVSKVSFKAHAVIAIPFLLYNYGITGLLKRLAIDQDGTIKCLASVASIWTIYKKGEDQLEKKTLAEQELTNVDFIDFRIGSMQFKTVMTLLWECIDCETLTDSRTAMTFWLETRLLSWRIQNYFNTVFDSVPWVLNFRRSWSVVRFIEEMESLMALGSITDADILGKSISFFADCKAVNRNIIWSLYSYFMSLLLHRKRAGINRDGRFVQVSSHLYEE